jgi:hypothetical protein
MVKRHLKRALELVLVPLAAAWVFLEETLLHYMALAMAAIGRWPPVARLEGWLRTLPPWAAVFTFLAPMVLLFPVKLAAIWFAVHHEFGLALTSLVVGKIVTTALVARLYGLLRPTLVTMPWYRRSEDWVFAFRDRVYAFVRALPAWQKARAIVQRVRAWVRSVVGVRFRRRRAAPARDGH